jgi:hypothetical protein
VDEVGTITTTHHHKRFEMVCLFGILACHLKSRVGGPERKTQCHVQGSLEKDLAPSFFIVKGGILFDSKIGESSYKVRGFRC